MRARFTNRTGYERWADIEEVTLIRLDGTVVSSLADAYCEERLLTPEEADKAIKFLDQEKGEQPQ